MRVDIVAARNVVTLCRYGFRHVLRHVNRHVRWLQCCIVGAIRRADEGLVGTGVWVQKRCGWMCVCVPAGSGYRGGWEVRGEGEVG